MEVIEAAFTRVGVTATFKFLPWNRAYSLTIRGTYPALISCAYSEERAKVIFFSDLLSQSTPGFFMRRNFDGPRPKTVKEAKELRVGAILGWVNVNELLEAGADVRTFRTEELGLRDLVKGLFDYLYTDKETAGFKAKQLGLSEKLDFIAILRRNYYLCFSRKWDNVEDLVARFNTGLAQVKQDGTYDAIHDKYR